MEYWTGINQGDYYLCDRCNVAKLSEYEYDNNIKQDRRYCEGCINWINIRKFKCLKCKNTGTMRNERLLPKVCCGQEVSWLR